MPSYGGGGAAAQLHRAENRWQVRGARWPAGLAVGAWECCFVGGGAAHE
jgi:hypothetical protein